MSADLWTRYRTILDMLPPPGGSIEPWLAERVLKLAITELYTVMSVLGEMNRENDVIERQVADARRRGDGEKADREEMYMMGRHAALVKLIESPPLG